MRILTELVGGIVLLLIFAYGINQTIKFIASIKDNDHDVQQPLRQSPDGLRDEKGNEPG